MRRWFAGILVLCLPFAAFADEPVETVTVNASALVGVWKVIWPQSAAITLRGSKFGPMQDRFCHIEQVKSDLTVHCFAGDLGRDGTVALDGDKIHLDASGGEKLRITVQDHDKGGKAALVRALLDGGLATAPHDDAALKQNRFTPDTLPKLGTIEAIAYLGQGPKFGSATELDFFTIYAVEFAGGERICGLHQRSDGTLDAFLCM